MVTLAHGGVTICQCRGERRKLKRFRPIDTLIKLSIFCQETELSVPFTLPATRRRWLKNFAGVTHGFSCVDDGLTLLAGCSPKDSLQSASVPLSPAFMIGGFVHFKVLIFAYFFRTHVPSRISCRPPYHAHARVWVHLLCICIYFVYECISRSIANATLVRPQERAEDGRMDPFFRR